MIHYYRSGKALRSRDPKKLFFTFQSIHGDLSPANHPSKLVLGGQGNTKGEGGVWDGLEDTGQIKHILTYKIELRVACGCQNG